MDKRNRGFTLVELLVVIGIIAVLISILLPSLNRARRAANNVACLSNMKQMGLAMAMYTNANKGSLPWSYYYEATNPGDLSTDWTVLLLNTLNGKGNRYIDQERDAGTRKLFIDKDTIDVPASIGMTVHYAAHPRLMPTGPLTPDPAVAGPPGGVRVPSKITRVKRSAEIVLIMDSAQVAENEWRSISTAWCIDGHQYDGYGIGVANASLLLEDSPNANNAQSIDPGPNVEAATIWNNDAAGSIRWRHMANNSANFLFVDGHAESRKLKKASVGGVGGQCDLLKSNVNTTLSYK
ncbi:MAG TPA: prepilin-type N-terminal cleavage/methylation domain-containing protein [Tepidisphaeraceae bacterium]|jgi:prepilin-type N-terminal cleavage/methylation domain-containing protein/prepilin-type processing-associated H-X9-DG protein|nr:prepilin-type N-terminal cleavage/methylation domain-containing protein [Tepidisphaeraceae bacterium]